MTLLSFLTHFAGFCLVSGFRSSFQLSLSNPCYVLLPTTSIFMGVCFLSLLSFLFSLPSFSFKLPYLLFFELSSSFPLFLLDYFREEKNPSVSLAELLLLTASLTVSLSRWLDFLGLSFSICQQNISTFTVPSVVWKKKKSCMKEVFCFIAFHLCSFLTWISEGPSLHNQEFLLLPVQVCIWTWLWVARTRIFVPCK